VPTLHVHAADRFVASHPHVYPGQSFGKDEAYHFLDVRKGDCPYTHIGVHPGVDAAQVIHAMRRGTDHLLELTPGAFQNFGEGFMVKAGLLHRPGTALTLEIQQPSDVYAFFQMDFGGEPLATEALHPGFDSIEAAAEQVINWTENQQAGLLEQVRLRPQAVADVVLGGRAEWVFPPQASSKFSGIRYTVETAMKLVADAPFVLFIWRGRGELGQVPVDGGGGPVGQADEFFIGFEAARRGVDLKNTGNQPLVAFALFAETL
jgi:hypothetical protein